MSEELNETGYEPEENEVYEPKNYGSKPIVVALKIVAGACVLVGIILAGMMSDMRGTWFILPLIGGGLCAVWWRFCAKVAEAVEKYLDE